LQNRRHAVVEFVIDSATVTVRIPNQSDLINAWDVGKDRWLWREIIRFAVYWAMTNSSSLLQKCPADELIFHTIGFTLAPRAVLAMISIC
jgi:hypothetical protein